MSAVFSRTLALRATMVALAAIMAFTFSTVQPVHAETAGQRSTRNIILAGVALAAGIILYNNYHHKQMAANTIVGRTSDGGTIYADGRIVYPDGTVVYTSNNGRYRCTYDGYGTPCGPGARAYRVARGYYGDRPYYDEDDQSYSNEDEGAYNEDGRAYNYAPRYRYVPQYQYAPRYRTVTRYQYVRVQNDRDDRRFRKSDDRRRPWQPRGHMARERGHNGD